MDIKPINRQNFGTLESRVAMFDAEVPASYKDELENPKLWEYITDMTMGSEVRITADDMSFIARGVCTYHNGSNKKVKIIELHELDKVEEIKIDSNSDFDVKYRGNAKWCVLDKDGEVLEKNLEDKATAVKWLADHERALAA